MIDYTSYSSSMMVMLGRGGQGERYDMHVQFSLEMFQLLPRKRGSHVSTSFLHYIHNTTGYSIMLTDSLAREVINCPTAYVHLCWPKTASHVVAAARAFGIVQQTSEILGKRSQQLWTKSILQRTYPAPCCDTSWNTRLQNDEDAGQKALS
jgi:hypothetical protein